MKNNIKKSTKIFNGSNKEVCAWILCDELILKRKLKDYTNTEIKFNPRNNPHWLVDENISDNVNIECIISYGKKLFKKISNIN